MTYNTIRYTIQGSDEKRYENHCVMVRKRPLTVTGAQRIVRRDHPNAIVTYVEVMAYGR